VVNHPNRSKATLANELLAALKEAYAILCAGKPPHSARESNARRAIRLAIERAEGK
jgi:hypothetical protein